MEEIKASLGSDFWIKFGKKTLNQNSFHIIFKLQYITPK